MQLPMLCPVSTCRDSGPGGRIPTLIQRQCLGFPTWSSSTEPGSTGQHLLKPRSKACLETMLLLGVLQIAALRQIHSMVPDLQHRHSRHHGQFSSPIPQEADLLPRTEQDNQAGPAQQSSTSSTNQISPSCGTSSSARARPPRPPQAGSQTTSFNNRDGDPLTPTPHTFAAT